jgi:hypothetical protein
MKIILGLDIISIILLGLSVFTVMLCYGIAMNTGNQNGANIMKAGLPTRVRIKERHGPGPGRGLSA